MKFQPKTSDLESLEARRLLSGSFASVNSNGTLSVVGTSKNDTITVQTSGSKVQAIVNGATDSFTSSAVKRIWIEAFGGNDKITNKTSLESTLIGDAGNDTIVGGSANDTIQAGSGDDHFDGGLGTNIIDEGTGNDAFDYSSETGSTFNITDDVTDFPLNSYGIEVNRNNGAGEDFAIEQSNLRTFIATPGNDQVTYYLDNEEIGAYFNFYGGDGNDQIEPQGESAEALLVDGGNGNDTITFGYDEPIESVYGGAGDDVINDNSGYPGEYIDGGSGFDTENLVPDTPIEETPTAEFTVPTGIEKFSVEVDYNLIINGNSLDNIINGNGANVTIYGNDGNDQLTGTGESVSLDGGSGNDLLHGYAAANSTLKGGSGNDTLIGDANTLILGDSTHPNYVYEGDSGIDTADFSGRTDNLILHIDGQPDSGAPGEHDQIMGDVENIIGGSGDDLITGNPSNNSLVGGAGNDTIWGSSGNDTLVGDAGHDQLYGQDGNDLLLAKDGQVDTLDGGNGYNTAQRDDSAGVKDIVTNVEKFE